MLGTRECLIPLNFAHGVHGTSLPQFAVVGKILTFIAIACTFLGPSRKRGPPKGYIDAIEARLHQTEALVGIMLATKDPRAKSLLDDMAKVSSSLFIIFRILSFEVGSLTYICQLNL